MQANDYEMSSSAVGWTAFISVRDWEYFERNIDRDSLKRLSVCRSSLISVESPATAEKGESAKR